MSFGGESFCIYMIIIFLKVKNHLEEINSGWVKWVKLLRHVQLFATPWTVTYQASLSMGFSRQGYWSGVPLPSPRRHIPAVNWKPWGGGVAASFLMLQPCFLLLGKVIDSGREGGRELSLLCCLNFSIRSLISDPYFTLSPAAPLSLNSGQQVVHPLFSFLQALCT